jgi:hypothetical protein
MDLKNKFKLTGEKLNEKEAILMKEFAEALVAQVVDDKDFSECLLCDSFGAYKDSINHTDACIFHNADKYLESLEK